MGGQWMDAVKHGYGLYSWPNGRSYRGQYRNDQAWGFGTFSFPDGSRYEGYWERGKQQGSGRSTNADGTATLLVWADGLPFPGAKEAVDLPPLLDKEQAPPGGEGPPAKGTATSLEV